MEKTTTFEVRHITVTIERSPADVYAFASNIGNLPRWASGLGENFEHLGGQLTAKTPNGRIKIQLCRQNPWGVLDHDVTLESGEVLTNPMRVVANGSGSEVTFVLFRRPEMTDAQFLDDAKWVEKDLRMLKALLET